VAKLLTRDEARRMAANFAKLPEIGSQFRPLALSQWGLPYRRPLLSGRVVKTVQNSLNV
jgi:hypothetical protein